MTFVCSSLSSPQLIFSWRWDNAECGCVLLLCSLLLIHISSFFFFFFKWQRAWWWKEEEEERCGASPSWPWRGFSQTCANPGTSRLTWCTITRSNECNWPNVYFPSCFPVRSGGDGSAVWSSPPLLPVPADGRPPPARLSLPSALPPSPPLLLPPLAHFPPLPPPSSSSSPPIPPSFFPPCRIFAQFSLYYGVLWPLSGLPVHASPACGLPVCLCALLLPRGLQRPGVRPGAHHGAGVWLLPTSRCLHQPQSSGSAASSASQLWHRTPRHWGTAERLPDPLPAAGCVLFYVTQQMWHCAKAWQSISVFFLSPSSSRTCVRPPLLPSVYGGDQTEESVGDARWTLPPPRLRAPSPHSDSGAVPEPADPPPCPPLPSPSLPAKTADPLQHLYSTAGQDTMSEIRVCYMWGIMLQEVSNNQESMWTWRRDH